jgi:hypothetical protein
MRFEFYDLRKIRPLIQKLAKEKGWSYDYAKQQVYERIELPDKEQFHKRLKDLGKKELE